MTLKTISRNRERKNNKKFKENFNKLETKNEWESEALKKLYKI